MGYPDIFFTEEWQELFKDTTFGGEPCHVNFAGIDYRFYKRPIEGTDYFDIVSPYGYSGPVAIEEDYYWVAFTKAFAQYCQRLDIIAEFARIHPFARLHSAVEENAHYEHDIVYIDLTQSEEQIWKGFSSSCRNHIRKAEKDGATIDWDITLEEFTRLYTGTMDKNHASLAYYFPEFFFFQLKSMSHFIGVRSEDSCSAMVLLTYGDYAHDFLRGSDYSIHGANNLLLWEAIKLAKAKGCKIFNLGGSHQVGDSCGDFKQEFSKTTKPFYTYRKIHNQRVYDQLCKVKGIDPKADGFFPAYRR